MPPANSNGSHLRVASPGPPWLEQSDWLAANDTLCRLLARHRGHAHDLQAAAGHLRKRLLTIFPVLDEMCAMSCPWCPDPCCSGARIWWDLRDLLFLHLNGLGTAARQPIGYDKSPCRYLGARGCRLARLQRPWICTWYLCAQQKAYLKRTAPGRLSALQAQIAAIQQGRRQLENEFIRLTAGRPFP